MIDKTSESVRSKGGERTRANPRGKSSSVEAITWRILRESKLFNMYREKLFLRVLYVLRSICIPVL